MNESQLKKLINAICITAVTVFFIMLLALVVLFSKKAALKRNVDRLEREITRAEQTANNLQEYQDKFNSIEYIEKYAREKLGMLRKGQVQFVPE